MNISPVIIIVAGCALVNYAIRLTPFLLTNWDRMPRSVRRFLSIMPTAALGALIFPGAFISLAETGRAWAALGGLLAAVLAANYSKNLIIPVTSAVAVTWLLLRLP